MAKTGEYRRKAEAGEERRAEKEKEGAEREGEQRKTAVVNARARHPNSRGRRILGEAGGRADRSAHGEKFTVEASQTQMRSWSAGGGGKGMAMRDRTTQETSTKG